MRYRDSDEKKTEEMKTASHAATPSRLFSNSTGCRRAASTTLRPSYGMGMWRVVVLLACLSATHAALFTEGGAVQNGPATDKKTVKTQGDNQKFLDALSQKQSKVDDEKSYQEFLEIVAQMNAEKKAQEEKEQLEEDQYYMNQYQGVKRSPMTEEEASEKETSWLKSVLARTNVFKDKNGNLRTAEGIAYDNEDPYDLDDLLKGEMMLENEIASDQDLKKTQTNLAKNTETAKANVESLESAMQTATGEPQVPQKKGQNEFVSFVEPEPQPAKQTVSSQQIDKRRLATSAEYSGNAPRYSSSSLLLLAVGTVMCVGLVGTVAGGTYYYKNNRRTETPDDGEYAPYAGTGPGFRKTKGNKGDETLAYKAQLHQYQQAKQKIICGEDAPGIIESDGEDGADEENNYSVYECPGLAPTGDIEVCNPNFAAQP